MTHSGPHNHPAPTADLESGAARNTTNLHPADGGANSSGQEDGDPKRGLHHVGQALKDLREALISSGLGASGAGEPINGAEALLAQIPALEVAKKELEALREQALRAAEGGVENPEQIAAQLIALQTEIARSQHLIQHATEFWLGWAGLLGLDTGYTAAGMAAPLTGTSEIGPGGSFPSKDSTDGEQRIEENNASKHAQSNAADRA